MGKNSARYDFSVEDRQLLVPNPSLVDFGKRNSHDLVELDPRINSLQDTSQDPAVMLRILSWLEKVESNPELYYGFDTENDK